ncbi:hypothetical protein BVY04_04590 [bacterium M21]|nr:hypothetical protein BVY04_04590 [bacterium M21]
MAKANYSFEKRKKELAKKKKKELKRLAKIAKNAGETQDSVAEDEAPVVDTEETTGEDKGE